VCLVASWVILVSIAMVWVSCGKCNFYFWVNLGFGVVFLGHDPPEMVWRWQISMACHPKVCGLRANQCIGFSPKLTKKKTKLRSCIWDYLGKPWTDSLILHLLLLYTIVNEILYLYIYICIADKASRIVHDMNKASEHFKTGNQWQPGHDLGVNRIWYYAKIHKNWYYRNGTTTILLCLN